MHLATFAHDGKTTTGAVVNKHVFDLGALGYPTTVESWLSEAPSRIAEVTSILAENTLPYFDLADVLLEVPIRAPRKIVAIGVNYLDHGHEQGIDPPLEPLVFSKFPSTIIGPRGTITWDSALTQQVDPEVELGVIIGARRHGVTADEALRYVFGYTVVNDVSARDLQFGDGQWTRGKSLDTFCPIGPVIVTSDEIPDPQALRLRLWVNERLQQDGTTADMIFSVAQIIKSSARIPLPSGMGRKRRLLSVLQSNYHAE
jgi:2-keto-4-pentenoate hydratase/2-oxohepta-3-ene-1,7-dioic acid hydratase in catechol pathway